MSIQIRDKSDKTFVVMGAGGSATSFVSKMLEEGGVDMNNPKTGNKKFFFEDRDFVNTNVRILHRAGGDWTQPPSEEAIMEVDMDAEMKKRISSKEGKKMWGFKDPRTSLTGLKWLPYLKGDVYLICCFRIPEKHIASWENSGKITNPDKEGLYKRINSSIVKIIKEFCKL